MGNEIFSKEQMAHLPLFFNGIIEKELMLPEKDSNDLLLSDQTESYAIIERPSKRISCIIDFSKIDDYGQK